MGKKSTERKPQQQPVQSLSPTRSYRWFLPLLALISFLCFSPSLFYPFLNWDDQLYVLNNPMVRDLSLRTIGQMFTTSFDGHYHPLIMLSFAIDYAIAGNHPLWFHLVNLLLHAANTCLVFLIIRKIGTNPLIAFLAALLWALHPLSTEAVVWVTARKDVLFGLFFLASLLCYLYYLDRSEKKYYLLSLVFMLLSAFSKEQAAFLAPSLLVFDFLKGRKLLSKKVILEKIPFFVIALVFGLAVIWAQKETGYIKPLNGADVSFANRLLLGSFGFIMYIFKWLVPYGLSAYYPYPFDALKAAPALYYLSLLIIPLMILLLFYLPRKNKIIAAGLWFFVINIFVMLRFLQANPGDFYIADRYMYISSLGLILLISALPSVKIIQQKINAKIIAVLFVLLIAASLALTLSRSMVWKDSISLLNDILEKHPNAYTALNCRGDIFLEEGKIDAALSDFNRAVALNAGNDRAFANRGRARAMSGDIEGALQDLNRAVSLAPRDPLNYINRGVARDLKGDTEGALQDQNEAIRINPGLADAWLNRGKVYGHTGNFSAAIADFNKVLQMMPDNADAYIALAAAKSASSDFQGATADFDKAVKLGSGKAELFFERGMNYYRMQQFQQALKDFTMVTQKQPGNAMAWAYKGFAEYNLATYAEAVKSLDQAIQLEPGFHLAYAMRGLSALKMGMQLQGCADLKLAARLGNKAAEAEYQKCCGN
jgi:tetratricopeptide (TPR) repeat protein